MSRASQRDPGLQESLDQEIASLLTAIEQEKIPDRLIALAVKLQDALIEKRKRDGAD